MNRRSLRQKGRQFDVAESERRALSGQRAFAFDDLDDARCILASLCRIGSWLSPESRSASGSSGKRILRDSFHPQHHSKRVRSDVGDLHQLAFGELNCSEFVLEQFFARCLFLGTWTMSPESMHPGNGSSGLTSLAIGAGDRRDHFADTRHPCHATDQEYLVDLIHFICASCIAISHISCISRSDGGCAFQSPRALIPLSRFFHCGMDDDATRTAGELILAATARSEGPDNSPDRQWVFAVRTIKLLRHQIYNHIIPIFAPRR